MKYIFIFLSFLFSAAPALVRAQPEQYQFSRIDINNGLSSNQINSILKDRKGFMWFGSMSGLNRYDGYKCKVFKHNSRDTNSLSDDYIVRILEGPEGSIWVETRNGFNVFDPYTETFERNLAKSLRRLSLPLVPINHIIKDAQGDYWFLMENRYLCKYSSRDKRTSIVYQVRQGEQTIASFAFDSESNLWIVRSRGGLEKINIKTWKVVLNTASVSNYFKNDSLDYSLFIDAQNELWVYASMLPRGVVHYSPLLQTAERINNDTGPYRLNNNIVVSIVQDNKGKIWISTDHGGINVLDKTSRSIAYILNNSDDIKSLGQNSITSAYKDNAGIIWIGTFKKGISYYHENIIKFPLVRHLASNPNSLNYNDVNRFVEDLKGNIWIGTNGGGLIYYNRQSRNFTHFVHDPGNPNSLSNDVIVNMYMDSEQKLWIGTYFGGLDCFDGKKFIHFRHNPSVPGSLAENRIWEIYEDSVRNLWIGTLAAGLDRYDRNKNIFFHYKSGDPNSIHSNYISAITSDKEGNLWIGTAYGIDVLEKHTGSFIHYINNPANPNSLSNNNVISIFEDTKDRIWIGTRDGLNVFNKKTKTFKQFRMEHGLPDNTILNILEDDYQNLWISTPNGLSNIIVAGTDDTISLQCKNYDEKDGLQGRAFNENAALKTKAGELIFGGPNGFNIFHPKNILPEKNTFPVILTDFQIFNKSIVVGDKMNNRIVLDESITEADKITLKYNENVFSVEFAALNFSNSEKNKYAFMLEGFNKEWLFTGGNERKVTYTNLDPGTYYFRVKASNKDGVWTEKPASLMITILPPFWKTGWAFIFYALFVSGALYLARRITLDRARMRFQIEQQRKEAERMHALDMMKIKFFTNVSHEFRTPLSLILSPLDKILKHCNDAELKKQLLLIHRNAKRLLNLVNQLLDFRKMEVQEFKANLTIGDIVAFIKDISYSFSDISEKKDIKFFYTSELSSLEAYFDKDKLEKIIFNLLSNAFKYTPSYGSVSVAVDFLEAGSESSDGKLILEVRDTGIGIPEDQQEKIFERFFQHEVPDSMLSQGSGIGLAITREFVKVLNGSVSVESEPEKGTSFKVILPLKRAATAIPGKVNQEIIAVDDKSLVQTPEENGHGNNKKTTILLVEDNEDFRFYLKDNLQQTYRIVEAVNGKEAWEKVKALEPDLVVSDIMMPYMNGIELSRKIRTDNQVSHVPVILLTAMATEEMQLEGYKIGVNDYITKPFTFEILQYRIKNILLQQKQLRKQFQKQIEVNPSEITITPVDEQFMKQALKVVEKNISNTDFSVEDLSRELFMSRVSLYKKLLALTGKTPLEFIRVMRLKRGAQLLEKSQMSVAQIAYEVGFNNPKNFTKYFKEEFDVIPSQYQAQRTKEIESSKKEENK
jgi:signal transduction histidine kinase/ligand-binding sensor domain-containing protein/DNA-binding response OmpR family regulator